MTYGNLILILSNGKKLLQFLHPLHYILSLIYLIVMNLKMNILLYTGESLYMNIMIIYILLENITDQKNRIQVSIDIIYTIKHGISKQRQAILKQENFIDLHL